MLCWRAIWKLRRNAIKTWERHLRAAKLQAFLCCCLCQQVGCVLPGATQASAGSSPNAAFLGDLAPASSTSASNPYQGWEREGREATGPGQQERERIGAIAPRARGHTRARAGRAVPPGGWDGAGTAVTQWEAPVGRFCAGASPLPFLFGSLPFCAQALLQGLQPPIPDERMHAGGSSHSPRPVATFLGPDPREPPPCPSAPSSHGHPSPPSFPLPGLNGLLRAGGGCSRAAFVECSQWSVTCKQISAIM